MYRVLSIVYKKFKKYALILSIHIACYLILATAPAGAEALSLGIDPSIITINAIPPTTITSSLNIQNKADASVTLQILINPFIPKGENGELEYSKEIPEIFKNIQILDAGIPVESIILGPRQQKDLDLNINVPQDTNISVRPPATSSNQSQTNQAGVAGEVGPASHPDIVGEANAGGRDYYFSIVFIQHLSKLNEEKGAGFISTDSPPAESTSSINQLGIATNVLLSIGAKEIPKASIEEFSSGTIFGKGPVAFTLRVKNAGAHFIKPKGEIIVKNMFGQSIGKLDLMNVNILSDSIRAIPNDIYAQELRLKDGSNTKTLFPADFKRPIVLWKEGFLLGLYTATLNISMSDEGPAFSRSIYFFAFPFQGLIIIAVIAIAAIVVKKRLKTHMTHSINSGSS